MSNVFRARAPTGSSTIRWAHVCRVMLHRVNEAHRRAFFDAAIDEGLRVSRRLSDCILCGVHQLVDEDEQSNRCQQEEEAPFLGRTGAYLPLARQKVGAASVRVEEGNPVGRTGIQQEMTGVAYQYSESYCWTKKNTHRESDEGGQEGESGQRMRERAVSE